MARASLLALLVAAGCARHAPPPACPEPVVAVVDDDPPPTAEDAAAIAALLDDWHQAASVGDAERYFAYFTPDAVFLGTDATERWTVDEFHEYAAPHFEDGHGWTMRATRREIVVKESHAYFDEDLVSEGLGPVRGSGVLHRTPEGWAIAHYVLSFTVPNERVSDLKALLESSPTEGADDSDGEEADAEE
jgi:ketosteroid isomerase-like protein